MSDVTDSMQNLLDRVKSNTALTVDSVVSQFTEQPDTEADNICSLIILAYTTVLEMGKTAMSAFGNIPEKLANTIMMVEAAGEMLLSTSLESGAGLTSGGGSNYLAPFRSEPQGLTEKQKWEAQRADQKAKANGAIISAITKLSVQGIDLGIKESHNADAAGEKQSGGDDKPWLNMVGTPATGFCSGLGGGLKDENFKRGIKLKEYVVKAFPQLQGALQDILDQAVNWTSTEGVSIFSSWLAGHDWSIHGQQRNTEQDERYTPFANNYFAEGLAESTIGGQHKDIWIP